MNVSIMRLRETTLIFPIEAEVVRWNLYNNKSAAMPCGSIFFQKIDIYFLFPKECREIFFSGDFHRRETCGFPKALGQKVTSVIDFNNLCVYKLSKIQALEMI